MSELTVHTNTAVAGKIEWAKAMAPSGLLPKAFQRNPANLLLAAEYADALGIERINALTAIHVIEGKPTLSADLMVALARRAGHKVRVQVKDDAARATLIRADDPDFTYEVVWTMDRASKAGLTGKGVWKSYPQAMLRSRAAAEVVRQGASEVLSGMIYTPEELGAEVDGNGRPSQAAPVVAAPVTADEILGSVEPEAAPVDVTAYEEEGTVEAELVDDDWGQATPDQEPGGDRG